MTKAKHPTVQIYRDDLDKVETLAKKLGLRNRDAIKEIVHFYVTNGKDSLLVGQS